MSVIINCPHCKKNITLDLITSKKDNYSSVYSQGSDNKQLSPDSNQTVIQRYRFKHEHEKTRATGPESDYNKMMMMLTDQLIKIIPNETFKQQLKTLISEYDVIYRETDSEWSESNISEKRNNSFQSLDESTEGTITNISDKKLRKIIYQYYNSSTEDVKYNNELRLIHDILFKSDYTNEIEKELLESYEGIGIIQVKEPYGTYMQVADKLGITDSRVKVVAHRLKTHQKKVERILEEIIPQLSPDSKDIINKILLPGNENKFKAVSTAEIEELNRYFDVNFNAYAYVLIGNMLYENRDVLLIKGENKEVIYSLIHKDKELLLQMIARVFRLTSSNTIKINCYQYSKADILYLMDVVKHLLNPAYYEFHEEEKELFIYRSDTNKSILIKCLKELNKPSSNHEIYDWCHSKYPEIFNSDNPGRMGSDFLSRMPDIFLAHGKTWHKKYSLRPDFKSHYFDS